LVVEDNYLKIIFLKNKFSEGKQNFSKAKISEAWEKYKEEGGALSNKDKS